MVTTMAEGMIVGVLCNALAVLIQQAVSSGQSLSPQVITSGTNQSAIQEYSDRSVTVCYISSRKFTIRYYHYPIMVNTTYVSFHNDTLAGPLSHKRRFDCALSV